MRRTPHWGLRPSPVPPDGPAEATAGRNSTFGKHHPLLGQGMSCHPDPNTPRAKFPAFWGHVAPLPPPKDGQGLRRALTAKIWFIHYTRVQTR